MRFIVDSCVSARACDALRQRGHHVEWVPDVYDGDPGDEAIIDRALDSDRVLVTGDKDFGEWIFLRGKSQPPLIRLAAMSPANQVEVLLHVVEKYEEPLRSGALITATTEKVRIRHREENG